MNLRNFGFFGARKNAFFEVAHSNIFLYTQTYYAVTWFTMSLAFALFLLQKVGYVTVLFILIEDNSTPHCLLMAINKSGDHIPAKCTCAAVSDLHFRFSVMYSN